MKFLDKLEKSKEFWFLAIISFFFFLLRFPSLFEPLWYGDEGIYQVMGMGINHGRLLYRDIWDNKPPLLYYLYALVQSDQFAIRLLSLLTAVFAIVIFYFLTKKLFYKEKVSMVTTGVFALLFATPLIEGNIANAENFMIPLILSAALLLFTVIANQSKLVKQSHTSTGLPRFARNDVLIFSAGILLGISFLFKVVALFDLAAFALFIFIVKYKNVPHIRNQIGELFSLFLGFIIPIASVFIFFLAHHALSEFIHSAFLSNVGYVNYGNTFLIPQGLLIIKLIILAAWCFFLFIQRKKFSHTSLFILLWIAFSIFNALFSQRPYTHYLLVMITSFSLFVGMVLANKTWRSLLAAFLLFMIIFFYHNFYLYQKTIAYYENFLQLVTNKKNITSYRAFFDPITPRDYELAGFLNMHMKKEDTLFIWGNNAQVYILTHKLPLGRYIVAYHITSIKNARTETTMLLKRIKPTYLIIMPNQDTPPVPLYYYQQRFTIDMATIYELVL